MTVTLLAACAPLRPKLEPASPAGRPAAATDRGVAIARGAHALIGTPYRYGASGPDAFDCSGLVSFLHARQGIAVPRSAAQQFDAARRIPRNELRPGDLVFFRLDGRGVSHVGVYTGHERFVHAPQSGRSVSEARLDDGYFAERYAGAGRLWGQEGGKADRR